MCTRRSSSAPGDQARVFQVLVTAWARKCGLGTRLRVQGFSKMAAGSVPGSSARPRVVVPTNAGTQPPARQCVVARPLDRQGVATNSPSRQPVST